MANVIYVDRTYVLGGEEPFSNVKLAWCKDCAVEPSHAVLSLDGEELFDDDGDTPSSLKLEHSDPIVVVIVTPDECAASSATTVSYQSSRSTPEDPFDGLSPVSGSDDSPCVMDGKRRCMRYFPASV